ASVCGSLQRTGARSKGSCSRKKSTWCTNPQERRRESSAGHLGRSKPTRQTENRSRQAPHDATRVHDSLLPTIRQSSMWGAERLGAGFAKRRLLLNPGTYAGLDFVANTPEHHDAFFFCTP